MADKQTFTLDGRDVEVRAGQSIMEAADEAGVYIPRLCTMKGQKTLGSCRVCTVLVNGRPQAACTQPAAPGIAVESDTEALNDVRRGIVEMLFVDGNHFCMFCEKSGDCELQALAYRLGIAAPQLPYRYPPGDVDATHPEVLIDRNRCILCGRCVTASAAADGKHVFDFVGRGSDRKIGVDSRGRLADTDLRSSDRAVEVCPVGAILRKRTAFATPVGRRTYDAAPIGGEIERKGAL
ncbi:MAG: 2Fe-2S iron-sulfur cluster-binding protein [Treponema sp.]|nr:2Fe-2S iron-sulfur cluster-binding protein [Treponema sp.]